MMISKSKSRLCPLLCAFLTKCLIIDTRSHVSFAMHNLEFDTWHDMWRKNNMSIDMLEIEMTHARDPRNRVDILE